MKPGDELREELKNVVKRYQSAPVMMSDDEVVEILDEIAEDIEAGL